MESEVEFEFGRCRLTLPPGLANPGDRFIVERRDDGSISLIPAIITPKRLVEQLESD
jgi:hypothetical protein